RFGPDLDRPIDDPRRPTCRATVLTLHRYRPLAGRKRDRLLRASRPVDDERIRATAQCEHRGGGVHRPIATSGVNLAPGASSSGYRQLQGDADAQRIVTTGDDANAQSRSRAPIVPEPRRRAIL